MHSKSNSHVTPDWPLKASLLLPQHCPSLRCRKMNLVSYSALCKNTYTYIKTSFLIKKYDLVQEQTFHNHNKNDEPGEEIQ